MKTLFILNDPSYGTEHCYNALRLAHAFLKTDPKAGVTVFPMADALVAAKASQKPKKSRPNAPISISRSGRTVEHPWSTLPLRIWSAAEVCFVPRARDAAAVWAHGDR